MKTLRIALAGLVALTVSTGIHITASDRDHDDRGRHLRATLIGFDEVPSVSTPAQGRFRAEVVRNAQGEPVAIEYTLTFSDLSSTVQQSHIHFAQPGVNGGIVLWLCQGVARAPAGAGSPGSEVPECPTPGGTVSGELLPNEVIAIGNGNASPQQIAAGEFAEVLRAIRAGYAYVNVHSATSPGGEIRGQISANGDDNRGRDH
jgi:hypothetical protein